jgi:hypothetical protein
MWPIKYLLLIEQCVCPLDQSLIAVICPEQIIYLSFFVIWLVNNSFDFCWPIIHVRFLRHRHLYLRSMSFYSNFQIYVLYLILKSMAVSHFLKSTSLTYPHTNKSAIDLRIWKRHRFENTLKSNPGFTVYKACCWTCEEVKVYYLTSP